MPLYFFSEFCIIKILIFQGTLCRIMLLKMECPKRRLRRTVSFRILQDNNSVITFRCFYFSLRYDGEMYLKEKLFNVLLEFFLFFKNVSVQRKK